MGWLLKDFLTKTFIFLIVIFLFPLNVNSQEPEIISEEIIPDLEETSTSTSPFSLNYKNIDLPGVERPEVEKFRQQYLLPKWNTELYVILKSGEQYRHYVRRRLLEEKMPLCIEFIPVIESSYKANAAPKDGRSVGLWQFLENSIENYLRKTEWIDERRDPWKSTDAALKKLKANYKTFGDWLLAIAAYNCGAGAVSRALKKSSEKTFWALCEKKLIPDHAINYVPKLLAISDLVTNSDYYNAGMPPFTYDSNAYSPLDDFDYITVDSMTSLKRLSMELRLDEKILQQLNPSLLHGVTPPNEKYELRLPAGMSNSAADALYTIANY